MSVFRFTIVAQINSWSLAVNIATILTFNFLIREKDEELDAILLRARALLYKFKQINGSTDYHEEYAIDSLQVASLLALFVSDHFGGNDKSAVIQRTRRFVSGSNHMKPFICTCASGITVDTSKTKQALNSVEDVVFHDVCEKSLKFIKERRNSIIVPIGSLQFGVCRHRALLMKVRLFIKHIYFLYFKLHQVFRTLILSLLILFSICVIGWSLGYLVSLLGVTWIFHRMPGM